MNLIQTLKFLYGYGTKGMHWGERKDLYDIPAIKHTLTQDHDGLAVLVSKVTTKFAAVKVSYDEEKKKKVQWYLDSCKQSLENMKDALLSGDVDKANDHFLEANEACAKAETEMKGDAHGLN